MAYVSLYAPSLDGDGWAEEISLTEISRACVLLAGKSLNHPFTVNPVVASRVVVGIDGGGTASAAAATSAVGLVAAVDAVAFLLSPL